MFSNDRNKVFSSQRQREANFRITNLRRLSRKIGKQRVIDNLKRITSNLPSNSPTSHNKTNTLKSYSLRMGTQKFGRKHREREAKAQNSKRDKHIFIKPNPLNFKLNHKGRGRMFSPQNAQRPVLSLNNSRNDNSSLRSRNFNSNMNSNHSKNSDKPKLRHGTHQRKKIVIRNNFSKNTRNKDLENINSSKGLAGITPSTKESAGTPMNAKLNNLKAKLKENLKNRSKMNTHNVTMMTPSRDSSCSFFYKTFNANIEICEKDQDFQELQATESEYQIYVKSLFDKSKLDSDARENIICKIKKICDTFELKDETFYASVLLNDLQVMADLNKLKDGKFKLDDLFDFSKASNGQDKCKRYETFFEAVACIVISLKYYEHEKEAPLVKEILDFFEIDNLIPLCRQKLKDDEDKEEQIIDILYDYLCKKQLEVLLKIEWKIPTVTLNNFLDHYVRILPDSAEQDNPSINGRAISPFASPLSAPTEMTPLHNQKDKSPRSKLLKAIKTEILECIKSIGNLCPLVKDYYKCNFAEMGIAVLAVTISFSFKCLTAALPTENKKLQKLKEIYVDWLQRIIKKYHLDKQKVQGYNDEIKEYLAKVNEQ